VPCIEEWKNMVFRNFYFKVSIRIALLGGVLFLFTYCLVGELYLRSTYLFVFSVSLAVELFFFITRFTNNIKSFLVGIQQRDYSLHFQEKKEGFQNLYSELNTISLAFKKISTEKEIQFRFLETLIEQIEIGIICFDNDGKIHLINKSLLLLIGKTGLTTFAQLEKISPDISAKIQQVEVGKSNVLKFIRQNQIKNFSLNASEFKLDGKYFKLVSVHNITNELNVQEVEAWQKLINVLTHEIMNSIAPIISLSDTLHGVVEKETETNSISSLQTLQSGINAIRIRSKGLHHFTEAYRQLSRIPDPMFSRIDLKIFIQDVLRFLKFDLDAANIKVSTSIENEEVLIDSNLMQQVMINLIKNSIDALEGAQEKMIRFVSDRHEGRIRLSIIDNGKGINPVDLDKIFIPFFTTKKNGSGIGLALARQIIQLHQGEITVAPSSENGTTFILTF
jgi:two-component system nitrogen regulation sensor histidine kinase NtrY